MAFDVCSLSSTKQSAVSGEKSNSDQFDAEMETPLEESSGTSSSSVPENKPEGILAGGSG